MVRRMLMGALEVVSFSPATSRSSSFDTLPPASIVDSLCFVMSLVEPLSQGIFDGRGGVNHEPRETTMASGEGGSGSNEVPVKRDRRRSRPCPPVASNDANAKVHSPAATSTEPSG